MNNRVTIGLAVGAGYLLGRTGKAKLAFTVGTLVMGRKLKPDAEALASFLGGRLKDHPQFKEMREQLREDLRGVGSAAAGALVDRQLEAVADRLHNRTRSVQDRLAGVAPGRGDDGDGSDESAEQTGSRPKKAAARRPAAKKSASRSSAASPRRAGGKAPSAGASADGSGGSGTSRRRAAKRTGGGRGEGSDDG
ncbi:DNA primase [Streptomyces sp. NPDC088762]|uniref:DNA primase n=1 Tax=Streptomyces sp. NPDC088762 TaxID=3365891 RepID=UPI00382C9958